MISSRSTVLRLGAVAIGRNEGEQLRSCLKSLIKEVDAVVFVDSGSTDQSVAVAKLLGVEVVELDMSQPFTMALGRNAGWRRLLELRPELSVIQFVDGDVEVFPGWLNLYVLTA
jgi:glycosyltransferase involved in cell wall biosynthesis